MLPRLAASRAGRRGCIQGSPGGACAGVASASWIARGLNPSALAEKVRVMSEPRAGPCVGIGSVAIGTRGSAFVQGPRG
jgi:hypothetical protein